MHTRELEETNNGRTRTDAILPRDVRRRAEAEGLSGKIELCLKDMRALGSEMGSFDLIWAEGSLFVMGFREGLEACHDLLTPRGLLGGSELSWLGPGPPAAW